MAGSRTGLLPQEIQWREEPLSIRIRRQFANLFWRRYEAWRRRRVCRGSRLHQDLVHILYDGIYLTVRMGLNARIEYLVIGSLSRSKLQNHRGAVSLAQEPYHNHNMSHWR